MKFSMTKRTIATPVTKIVSGLTSTLSALEQAQADNQKIIAEQETVLTAALETSKAARTERDAAAKIAANIQSLLS